MRYSRSLCFLVVVACLLVVVGHDAAAQGNDEPKRVANVQTKFYLFDAAPGTSYEVQKNSSTLTTITSSFFGVLSLTDVATSGDRYIFIPSGVNPQPPSLPTGFTVAGSDSGCATLGWNANPEGDITGYTVYFDTLSVELGQIGAYRDSITVGGAVTNLQSCGFPDGTYYFALRARNAFNLLSQQTGEVVTDINSTVTTQPPLPPVNISAVETSPGCVTITWGANGEPDLAGYVIYFGPLSVAGGQTTDYADSVDVGPVTTQVVCNVASGVHYFALKAYNTSSDFSAYSAEHNVNIGGADVLAPTIAVTGPVSGDVVVGAVAVTVAATDNVGVVGVQLQVDGVDVGAESTTAPYSLLLDTSVFVDGIHAITARARDAAGNSTTSTSVDVVFDNDNDPNHPRILLSGSGLSGMRARACIDDLGNPIPGCTTAAQWDAWQSYLAPFVVSGSYGDMRAWHFALMYKATKDPAWATRARALLNSEIANGMGAERAADYENVDDYLMDAALVYDWLQHFMDVGEKAIVIGYLDQLVSEVWDPSGNVFNTWSGIDTDDPGSYRYYRFLLGAGVAALATDGDNPTPPILSFNGTTYNDLMAFVADRLDQEAFPAWLNGNGVGGAWHEGDAYGRDAKAAMLTLFTMLEEGSARSDMSSSFVTSSLLYHLYSIQPGDAVRHPGGDLNGNPAMAVDDDDRGLMLWFAHGLGNGNTKQYAQYWLDTVAPPAQSGDMLAWNCLLYDGAQPSRDYRELASGYAAAGVGWFNSRSSWDADAVSLSFVSSDNLQSPQQHGDQNSFVIYHQGWQAVDASSFSTTGNVRSTDIHNTILVDGVFQRTGAGTGRITKSELAVAGTGGADYGYVVGDASDAYHSGGASMLNVYQREMVHVAGDQVIVFDRVTAVDASATVTYLLQTANTPTIVGGVVTATNGAGKLFQKTLLPENATLTPVHEQGGPNGLDSWKVEVTPLTAQANTNFLHVINLADAAASTMDNATLVRATTGGMVGVRIEVVGEDVVVMFSDDPTGAAPSGGVIYDVSATTTTSQHLLLGLLPDTDYAVEWYRHDDGHHTVSVVAGAGGYRTTTSGALCFSIGDAEISMR